MAPKRVQTENKVFPHLKKLTSPLKRSVLNKKKSPVPLRLLLNSEDGLQIKNIPGKGRGIVASRTFHKNDFVVEYKGDLISYKAAIEKEKHLQNKDGNFMYFFKHLEKPWCIDATAESDFKGRLINHGDPPNVKGTLFNISGEGPRLGFVALKTINPGEEVVYDYGDRRPAALKNFPWLKKKKVTKEKKEPNKTLKGTTKASQNLNCDLTQEKSFNKVTKLQKNPIDTSSVLKKSTKKEKVSIKTHEGKFKASGKSDFSICKDNSSTKVPKLQMNDSDALPVTSTGSASKEKKGSNKTTIGTTKASQNLQCNLFQEKSSNKVTKLQKNPIDTSSVLKKSTKKEKVSIKTHEGKFKASGKSDFSICEDNSSTKVPKLQMNDGDALPVPSIGSASERQQTVAHTDLELRLDRAKKSFKILCSIPLKKLDDDLIYDLKCRAIGMETEPSTALPKMICEDGGKDCLKPEDSNVLRKNDIEFHPHWYDTKESRPVLMVELETGVHSVRKKHPTAVAMLLAQPLKIRKLFKESLRNHACSEIQTFGDMLENDESESDQLQCLRKLVKEEYFESKKNVNNPVAPRDNFHSLLEDFNNDKGLEKKSPNPKGQANMAVEDNCVTLEEDLSTDINDLSLNPNYNEPTAEYRSETMEGVSTEVDSKACDLGYRLNLEKIPDAADFGTSSESIFDKIETPGQVPCQNDSGSTFDDNYSQGQVPCHNGSNSFDDLFELFGLADSGPFIENSKKKSASANETFNVSNLPDSAPQENVNDFDDLLTFFNIADSEPCKGHSFKTETLQASKAEQSSFSSKTMMDPRNLNESISDIKGDCDKLKKTHLQTNQENLNDLLGFFDLATIEPCEDASFKGVSEPLQVVELSPETNKKIDQRNVSASTSKIKCDEEIGNKKSKESRSRIQKDKRTLQKEESSFTEDLKCSKRGQLAVRKILRIISKNASLPYGPELLQDPSSVITAIESLPISGKTMLFYFAYCIKALKEMSLAHYPKAQTALQKLQKYKDIHYQHYAKSTNERKLSNTRKEFVETYKTKYETFILQVNTEMSAMEKPIKITLQSALGKKWTKVVGFLSSWVQDEIGHEFFNKISKSHVLAALRQPGGEYFTIAFEEDGSPKYLKTISARLYKCLVHYSNMRSWRLPKNNVFFVGVIGSSFVPTEYTRYIPD